MKEESPSICRYWLCPLYSFESNCDSVTLAKEIEIKKIPKGFADFLYENYSDWALLTDSEHGTPEYVVVITSGFKCNGQIYPLKEVSEKSELLFDLITALRLCHAGEVVPGPFLFGELIDSEIFNPIMHHSVELFTSTLTRVCRTNIGIELLKLVKYKFCQTDISCEPLA